MIICEKCKVKMNVDKNGVGVDFGYGHVYASDRYKCPKCGDMVLLTTPSAYFDPTYENQKEYLKIQQ